MSALEIPAEVWLKVFEFLSDSELFRLNQTCRLLNELLKDELFLCKRLEQRLFGLRADDRFYYTAKKRLEICKRWQRSKYLESTVIKFRMTHLVPWLQVIPEGMFITQGKNLTYHQFNRQGQLFSNCSWRLNGPWKEDLCRFATDNRTLCAGSRGGHVICWDLQSDQCQSVTKAHQSDVHSVDMNGRLIVSGSKDKTAKIWSRSDDGTLISGGTLDLNDRVWSVCISPCANQVTLGTAANYGSFAPVSVWDTNSCAPIHRLGLGFKRGAGALQLLYETPNLLLSTGYDTYLRMWDLRTGQNVISWVDMFDNSLFSMASDHNNTIFAGASRHGLVWAFDKRQRSAVQHYYVGDDNRPVYSLGFTTNSLLVCLDSRLVQLLF